MPIRAVEFGEGTKVFCPDLVNLYECKIADGVKIGPFVEIQKGVTIGRFSTISSHSFLCEGVTIGQRVFVGHNVAFCNEKYPVAGRGGWELKDEDRVAVHDGARIGSGAVILPGVTIGRGALVGAGSVVTKDVAAYTTVYGNPARTKEEWEALKSEDIQGRNRGGGREAIPPPVPVLGQE